MSRVVSLVASLTALAVATTPIAVSARERSSRDFPVSVKPESFQQSERDYDALFAGRPAVQRVRVPGGIYISRPVSGDAPQALLAQRVEIDIRSTSPTLADLQTMLEVQGINLTIDYRSLQDGAAAGSTKVDSFTAASRYQEVANSVAGGRGVQNNQQGGAFGGGFDGGFGGGFPSQGTRSGVGDAGGTGAQANVTVEGSSVDENVNAPVQQPAPQTGVNGERSSPAFFERSLPFRYFQGTVGELMRRLENTGNIAVWYDNGFVIGDVRRYAIAVPQQRDIIQSVVNELTRMGASDVTGSIGASQVVYSAPPRTQAEIIEPYLRRISGNMSEITMQIALVTVAMSRDAERGFDWSALNLGLGQNVTSVPVLPADGGTAVNTPLGSGSFVFTPNNFQTNLGDLLGVNRVLSVASAISFLSRIGNTSVAQNVELRTLSGSPVILRSGEDIPYVQNVTSQSTGSLGGGALGGSQTARLGTGLTLNVDPRYDSSSGIVTMDIGLKLVDLVEFVQLSAGNQLGTLTQPRTREQGVNSILRLPAGQTTILGGIRRELTADQRNGPLGLFGIGKRDRQHEVFWLFAIVRPVVTVYETADMPIAPRSVLDSRTTVNPYDEGSYGSPGVSGSTTAVPSDPQTTNAGGIPTMYREGAGITPANRQPAGVITSAPPAPRGIVVPGAGTAPEVNAHIPSGSVLRDPGAPGDGNSVPIRGGSSVGALQTGSLRSEQVAPTIVAPAKPATVVMAPVTPVRLVTPVKTVPVSPVSVKPVPVAEPEVRGSFIRPMTAEERSN